MEISNHLIHIQIHRGNPQLIEQHHNLASDLQELHYGLINGGFMMLLTLHNHVLHPVFHIRLGNPVQGAKIIGLIMIAGGEEQLPLLINQGAEVIIRRKEHISPVGSRAVSLGLKIDYKAFLVR